MNDRRNETQLSETATQRRRPRGTGSLYQQSGSSSWYLKFYRNGKVYRQSAGTTNRRKAERLLQRKIGEIAMGNFLEPVAERSLVICTRCAHPTDSSDSSRFKPCGCLAADLLTEYKANARHSLVNVRRNWNKHLAPRFENVKARDVRTDALNRYMSERQAEGASNASINRELAALKRAFKLGMIAGCARGHLTFSGDTPRDLVSRRSRTTSSRDRRPRSIRSGIPYGG